MRPASKLSQPVSGCPGSQHLRQSLDACVRLTPESWASTSECSIVGCDASQAEHLGSVDEVPRLVSVGVPARSVRLDMRKLPKTASFWILAALYLIVVFASAAATPLYRVYQVEFDFSAATLTAIFAVYVLVLLLTLLF